MQLNRAVQEYGTVLSFRFDISERHTTANLWQVIKQISILWELEGMAFRSEERI